MEGTGSASRPSVLLTLPDLPWPANAGKRMRCRAALAAVSDVVTELGGDLDVLVLMAGPEGGSGRPPGVPARAWIRLDPPLRPRLGAALSAATARVPWQVGVVRWGKARAQVRALPVAQYDLVWFGALDHAVGLRSAVRARRSVIDLDDVETAKIRSFLATPADTAETTGLVRLQRRIELPLWGRLQRWAQRHADAVVVCSELDRQRLGAGPRLRVVPNSYPLPPDGPAAPAPATAPATGGTPPTLLLVGTFSYGVNLDAAQFAAEQVLPRVRRRHPQARLRLVGRGGGPVLEALGRLAGVEVVGPVDRMEPELAAADVSLVPVRYGGGTRLKVLEAFAHGVPVVSTPLGCEGIEAQPDVHLLVAASADGLADAVDRLLREDDLRVRLTGAAARLASERYRPEIAESAARAVAREALATRG